MIIPFTNRDQKIIAQLFFLWSLFILFTACTEQRKTDSSIQTIDLRHHDSLNKYDSVTMTNVKQGIKLGTELQMSDIVRRIFQDKNGHYWFGTNSDGICRYNGQSTECFSTDQGLAGYQVTGIIEDKKGMLWISTNGGITMYDGRSFTNFTTKDGLSNNWVWCLFEDSQGTIWTGTVDGLCCFDAKLKKFIPFPIPKSGHKSTTPALSPNLVFCITEDKKGNMWFGTDGDGVCIYDRKSFRYLTTDNGLCNNSVTCILIDKIENIWFSSMFGGVSQFNGKSFTNFTMQNKSIGDNEVWTINEDTTGKIWFSSEGYGVYCYDPSSSQKTNGRPITNFSKKNGLEVLAVQSIYEDKAGKLWFGGGGGVYRFSEQGKTFVNIKTNGPWQ